MSQNLNPKEAERKVQKLSAYTDGLGDISLGLVMLLLGIYPLTRSMVGPELNVVLFLGMMLALVTVLTMIKKRITPVRVGMVKFGATGKKRQRNALIITTSLVLLTIATWLMSAKGIGMQTSAWHGLPEWLSVLKVDIFVALVMLAIFCSVAYTFSVPRYYLYGALVAGGSLVSTVLMTYAGAKVNWPLMLAGLIIVAIGIGVLFRFLKDYPAQTTEA